MEKLTEFNPNFGNHLLERKRHREGPQVRRLPHP